MTAKLTDLQLVLLSSAAARVDGSLLPRPESVAGQLARIRKTIPPLLKRSLVEEVDVTDPAQAWREEDERRIGVVITSAGRVAVGQEEPASPEPAPAVADVPTSSDPEIAASPTSVGDAEPAARTTKAGQVLVLLGRAQGATLAELIDATSWLPHTTRAALTGLRKKGHAIARDKRGEETCYRIVEAG